MSPCCHRNWYFGHFPFITIIITIMYCHFESAALTRRRNVQVYTLLISLPCSIDRRQVLTSGA